MRIGFVSSVSSSVMRNKVSSPNFSMLTRTPRLQNVMERGIAGIIQELLKCGLKIGIGRSSAFSLCHGFAASTWTVSMLRLLYCGRLAQEVSKWRNTG